MVSNFGGDGGDVLVDPNDGCNIVQEYVVLSMSVTQTCAHPTCESERVPRPVEGDDVQHRAARRQRALHRAVRGQRPEHQRVDRRRQQPLVAGEGLRIRKPSEWTKAYTLADRRASHTALAMRRQRGDRRLVRPDATTRGFVARRGDRARRRAARGRSRTPRLNGAARTATSAASRSAPTELPRRSERVQPHVHRRPGRRHRPRLQVDRREHWTDISAELPGRPGQLDQGAVPTARSSSAPISASSTGRRARPLDRLGTNLPLTVAMDVELGPDDNIYAATHGRGIWRIAQPRRRG